MKRLALMAALGLVLGACSSFENPEVIVDLRVVAITSDPPEQVVAFDVADPPTPAEVLAELGPIDVCALIADPAQVRGIHYAFTLCEYDDGGRCAPDLQVPLVEGVLPDPETAAEPRVCLTITPDDDFLAILVSTLRGDQLAGLGGIDALLQLTVRGEDEPTSATQYAARTLRVTPRIPAARQANVNPTLDRLDVELRGGASAGPVPLPPGRCRDQPAPFEVAPGQQVRLTPVEPATARETYVVPTLDGRTQTFTESLTYQWIATAGNFSAGSTGGTRDGFGNLPELFTDWRAPRAADLTGPTDVDVWLLQRDERLGLTPHLACLRVVP